MSELIGNAYRRTAKLENAKNVSKISGINSCDRNVFRLEDFPLAQLQTAGNIPLATSSIPTPTLMPTNVFQILCHSHRLNSFYYIQFLPRFLSQMINTSYNQ